MLLLIAFLLEVGGVLVMAADLRAGVGVVILGWLVAAVAALTRCKGE